MSNTRKLNIKFLELMDEGQIDPKKLSQDLLGWMTEDDIKEFAQANDYVMVFQEPVEKIDISGFTIPNFFFENEDEDTYSFYAASSFLTVDDGMTGPILNLSFDFEENSVDLSFTSYNNHKSLITFSFEDYEDLQNKINNLGDYILSEWKKYYENQNGRKIHV